MTINAILLAVGGFVAWYVVSSLWTWRRLRHIPGPRLGSFSYLWVGWKSFSGGCREYEHLQKYGPVVRVGPNYVVLADPDDIRRLNGSRSHDIRRDPWYTGGKMDPDHDTIFGLLHPEPHDALKARVSAGYSGRDGIDFEAGVDGRIGHLVDVLRQRFVSKPPGVVKSVDFAYFIRYFTLDTITQMAFGRAFGFMDAEGDLYGYTREIEKLLSLVALAGDVPLLRRIFISPVLARWLAPKPTDTMGVGKLLGVAHKIVDDRMERDDEKVPDMIHGLNAQDIKNETLIQIVAGSDTTATAIRSTMLYLMTTPRVYSRLGAEIREAVASGVSKPITVDQAKKLPYLQAVIWEGLRMRPPAIYGFYKVIPPGGDHIQGKFIPGGTAVGFNMPAMMRQERIFGSDVQLFRPERFLECSEHKKTEMSRTVDLAFGYGRWMCAGKTLALVELHKIFFELLREFEWQLVYPGNAWAEKAHTVMTQRDMWVSLTEVDTA
ncbi:hypothetical protein LQW54_009476 [Pestalotiopsis sp. IQ-011]